MPKKIAYPPLNKNITADVAIIGGGLAGISAAYFLSKAGKNVVVLESLEIGSGATSKTTAFVTNVIDTSLTDLEKSLGSKKAKLVWQSHLEAIDVIEQIIQQESIDCSFKRVSNYYYANDKKGMEELAEEYKLAKRLGFKVNLLESHVLPFNNAGVLKIENQGKFDAGEYLKQLAEACAEQGVKIFENTEVSKIKTKEEIFRLEISNQASVTANQVIIATYYPLNNPKSTLFKKGMYVSYVLEMQVPKGALPEAIYEDTANPYNYFRVDPPAGGDKKFDTVLFGGADHRTEIKMNPKKNYKALEDYIQKTFPRLKYKITSRWTGPILEPSDGLALIGETRPGQYVATAFSGNGMTYSTISGMLLRDLVLKKKNPWQQLYDPKRIPTLKQLWQKGRDYTEELFKGALKNAF